MTSALKWFNGYLTNIYQVVWIHSSLSDPMPVECGVPQRSILSRRPIISHKLCVLCVNDLEEVPLKKEWVLLYRMLCRQYKIVCFFPLTTPYGLSKKWMKISCWYAAGASEIGYYWIQTCNTKLIVFGSQQMTSKLYEFHLSLLERTFPQCNQQKISV